MAEGGANTTPVDLHPDNIEDAGTQVDASALALAAVFGPVSFPPNMSEAVKAMVMDRAEQMRNAAGDFALDNRSAAERLKDEKDRAQGNDNLSLLAQLAQEQQAEREEWMRTRSTVGGVTMTGQEWQDFAKRLREDDRLRAEILEIFVRRGATREEAEHRYETMIDAAEAAATPPAQRSEAQQRLLSDPQVVADLELADSFRQKGPEPQKTGTTAEFQTAALGQAATGPAVPTIERPVVTVTPDAAF